MVLWTHLLATMVPNSHAKNSRISLGPTESSTPHRRLYTHNPTVWLKKQFKQSTKNTEEMNRFRRRCTSALLDLRNNPMDAEIGSPMQRLMSRRAKTLISTNDNLRKPCVVKPSLATLIQWNTDRNRNFTMINMQNQDRHVHQGPVSLKGLSFGRKLVRLTHLVPKDTTA